MTGAQCGGGLYPLYTTDSLLLTDLVDFYQQRKEKNAAVVGRGCCSELWFGFKGRIRFRFYLEGLIRIQIFSNVGYGSGFFSKVGSGSSPPGSATLVEGVVANPVCTGSTLERVANSPRHPCPRRIDWRESMWCWLLQLLVIIHLSVSLTCTVHTCSSMFIFSIISTTITAQAS